MRNICVHLGSHLYLLSFDSVCEYWLLGSLVESSVEYLVESMLWSYSRMEDKDVAGGY